MEPDRVLEQGTELVVEGQEGGNLDEAGDYVFHEKVPKGGSDSVLWAGPNCQEV